MSAMAYEITGVSTVYLTVCTGADQRMEAPRHWPLWRWGFAGDIQYKPMEIYEFQWESEKANPACSNPTLNLRYSFHWWKTVSFAILLSSWTIGKKECIMHHRRYIIQCMTDVFTPQKAIQISVTPAMNIDSWQIRFPIYQRCDIILVAFEPDVHFSYIWPKTIRTSDILASHINPYGYDVKIYLENYVKDIDIDDLTFRRNVINIYDIILPLPSKRI